jgi:hypothetical protein
MENLDIPNDKREFRCNHCNGKILIPKDLPPTTGPCPHCSGEITSPAPKSPDTAVKAPPATGPSVPPAAPKPKVPDKDEAAPPAARRTPGPPPPPVRTPPPAPIPKPPGLSEPEKPAPAVPAAPQTKSPGVTALSVPESTGTPVEIPHADEPSKCNKRKAAKAEKSNKHHKSGLIPVMLVILMLILGAGVAIYFVTKEMGRNIAPPVAGPSAGGSTAQEDNYIRTGWQRDASQLLSDYMAATTSEEKLPYILNGEGLKSRLEDFYGGGFIDDSDTPADSFSIYELPEDDRRRGLFMMIYDQPPQFEMKEFFRPLASLEVQYGIDEAGLLLSTLARVGNFAMEPLRVHAFFKRTPDGLKLDWETFAQTKYRTFQNFVELPEAGQSGIFRVFIVEDVPDKGHLEAGTRTYRVADPANITDTARINVRVDSEIGRALSIINWRGTKESRPITRPATVELEWAGEPSASQLAIRRFICWEFVGLGGKESSPTASTK